jgi:hypothetical protein
VVSTVAVQVSVRVEPDRAQCQPTGDGVDANVSPDGSVTTSCDWWNAVPETAGLRVSVYPEPAIAAAGVPDVVSESSGIGVTVTVAVVVAGTARSPASVSTAVVV